jgi:Polyketide cyclase / dehydrase and lipid transport
MSRIGVRAQVDGSVGEAERLWYDHRRWPNYLDGFGHVVKVDGEWPRVGARTVWDSTPAGRGRVSEEVVEHEPGAGQALAVEDPRLRGTQRVSFLPREGGTEVRLELDYRLKERNPLTPVVDVLFIRRALRDSLRRTLARFGNELAADRELLR